ncbi:MAG: glycosyltransferase [Bacteroidetes bacterium]|nr:glycosyltransferase [Bacteroidota bacterium]
MKIALIGTYPPRQCGIGTFTRNLARSIVPKNHKGSLESLVDVVAINNNLTQYNYAPEVKFIIVQEDQRDYTRAADFINFGESRLCILEHEFGIFGGESGVYILPFIHRLQVPLIVTFHTILEHPNFLEKSIIQEIGKNAQKMVVMSKLGIEFLKNIYRIPEEKISLIEHGVPEYKNSPPPQFKKKFNLKNRKVLFTFGLLGRNKGIETVINALPQVVGKHPEVIYLILGNTHPSVILSTGESYRQKLRLLVRQKKLENHVYFIKQFVSEEILFQYLSAADIYLTPYINQAQITSGTLSYAIGAGAAVVSTPYWHAKELLSQGIGELFDFKDSDQLADILNDLLDHPAKLNKLKARALDYGKHLKWSLIGKQYLKLCNEAVEKYSPQVQGKTTFIDPALIPTLSLNHLKRLTDDTGIVQHAKYGIPNLKEGYCLDDNARALFAALMAYRRTKNEEALELMPVYFSYIHYMQNVKGTFRNFLSFDRRFLDEEGSEDAFGRTIWALGYLIRFSPNDAYFQLGLEIFKKASANFENLNSIRGIANTINGICHYLHRFQSDEKMIQLLDKLSLSLVDQYYMHSSEDWKWFEDELTYDNGIIPLALFSTAEITGNQQFLQVAEESTKFLEGVTLKDGYFAPVGSNGWYPRNGKRAQYAQQATDVMIMVLLYYKSYQVLKKKGYIKKMFQTFTWFYGENDLRVPLFDHETKGCCDGLESYGVNRNQGAESTLAYLISHMTVLNAIELEHEFGKRKKKILVEDSSKYSTQTKTKVENIKTPQTPV